MSRMRHQALRPLGLGFLLAGIGLALLSFAVEGPIAAAEGYVINSLLAWRLLQVALLGAAAVSAAVIWKTGRSPWPLGLASLAVLWVAWRHASVPHAGDPLPVVALYVLELAGLFLVGAALPLLWLAPARTTEGLAAPA